MAGEISADYRVDRIEAKLDRIIGILEYRERLAILEGNMPALVEAISAGFKSVKALDKPIQGVKVHKNTVRSSIDRDVRWRRDSFKRRQQRRDAKGRWSIAIKPKHKSRPLKSQ